VPLKKTGWAIESSTNSTNLRAWIKAYFEHDLDRPNILGIEETEWEAKHVASHLIVLAEQLRQADMSWEAVAEVG
jgi:hypothetical protein